HGKRFTYAMLTPQHLALEKHREGSKKFATKLIVYKDPLNRSRGSTELAVSIDATESASLAALGTTLGAVAFSAAASTSPANSGVLCCEGCGAPLIPVDQAVVTCHF